MTTLNSADLRERVKSAGIAYLPADQVFYKRFPYKVELSPRFKGMGGVSGKRGCQIDISDPIRARQKLAEFNEMIEKVISNVEYRFSIREFVDRLPKVEYKSRMGGENNLFYLRDPEIVMILIDRYGEVINSVTGPVSEDHQETLDDRNVVMREKLYYDQYRYVLEFPFREDFEPTAKMILDYLQDLGPERWRASRLDLCIRHFQHHATNGTTSPMAKGRRLPGTRSHRLGSPMLQPAVYRPTPREEKIFVYLSDPNDYIYIKMMGAEYVISNHEVVLFDELT
jgi:hypothetical protein